MDKVLVGRKAVEAYRKAHSHLLDGGWHKGIPEEHTPLLNIMLRTFKGLGFDSIKEFFSSSLDYDALETGIGDIPFYKNREDLVMLGQPTSLNGVDLRQTDKGMELMIDGESVMDTSPGEHASMMISAQECPSDARVFIGGLGLGIILAYLKHFGVAKEIIVCEIDDRVIYLLGKRITDYLSMPIQIIHGDAKDEIQKYGKFDWIYIDLVAGEPKLKSVAMDFLTSKGVYTLFNSCNFEVWK